MFQPENELGVIVAFAQEANNYGFDLLSIRSEFPDAVVSYKGERYKAEFEYHASSFKRHRHDLRQCDIIVCWENDWPDCILPIISLSDNDWNLSEGIEPPPKIEREAAHWKLVAQRLQRRVTSLENEVERYIPDDNEYTSQYRGVYFNNDRKNSPRPWRACAYHEGERHHLGSFASEAEAAKAYDAKSYELRGEDATLNFPDEYETDEK